ncbi:hypothetical protein C8J57DRAFT_1282560 [Mycena rebaudengoi]|nr:hypothetical protein C8J57DRAFT_1282560 [Mycena rebaudengoi]
MAFGMKRGFLKAGAPKPSVNNSPTTAIPLKSKSTAGTTLSGGSPLNASRSANNPEIRRSDPSRVLSEIPRIVVADCAIGYTHYLFLPPTNSNIVLVDSRQNVESISTWPIWKQPPPSPLQNPPFTVQDCGEKGRGIFARRPISVGDVIMRERPVCVVHPSLDSATDTKTRMGLFSGALADLSYDTQASITSLHNAEPKLALGHIHGVILSNALPTTVLGKTANHDCYPNAAFFFNIESFTGRFYAARPIAEGEEITISYTLLALSRKERQAELFSKYNFACACATCCLSPALSAASDQKRQAVGTYLQMRPPNVSLAELKKLTRWAEAEGMFRESMSLLFESIDAADREGDESEATHLTHKALMCLHALEGADSPMFIGFAQRMGATPKQLVQRLQDYRRAS